MNIMGNLYSRCSKQMTGVALGTVSQDKDQPDLQMVC